MFSDTPSKLIDTEVSKIEPRTSSTVHVHAAGNRRVFGQANQNVRIRRTAMVRPHQPGQTAFISVLPKDIEGDIE
jgi:hypothetical protein